jgi:hypothetical protein
MGQNPVKAKIESIAPTNPVNRNQIGLMKYPRSELPSTKIPARSLMNRSRYHVFVSAMYMTSSLLFPSFP